MITGYTDEEFWQLEVPSIDARIWKTFERLQRERDKARHVAKVLVGPAKHLKILGHDLTVDELKAIDAALAYPEREP